MKDSDFVYDSTDGMHYKCNKLSLNCNGFYIDSPDWIKSKKATINPKSNDDKCSQYVVTTTLNHQNIKNHPERIYIFYFFNCYLAAPRPTSGHYRGDSLTHPMLITAFLHIRPEGHREPRSEVGSLSPAERLVGFEPGTFRF